MFLLIDALDLKATTGWVEVRLSEDNTLLQFWYMQQSAYRTEIIEVADVNLFEKSVDRGFFPNHWNMYCAWLTGVQITQAE